ncbi:hypothetical protein [Nostoc sp. NMS4]|uniref:hypothetical protein n=1 Tax=Nostoc sp. NMS4 TaxID=2815390 RepID=UPI0025FBCB30|nr:hypothetical protein [Nostoc sp. NMS4]MBN3924004.1 hypothetical protein [Nostoc sp. NMS4]
MACEGAKKGKVSFIDKGTAKEIAIPIAPFFVSCSPTSTCGVSGIRQINYSCSNPIAPNGVYSFSSFKNESVFFKAVASSGTYDGNQYDFWGSCPDGQREIRNSFSRGSGAITIISNVFTSGGNSGLIIKDANNNILLTIPVSECNYQISCGDECPEGFCKCIIPEYPGYCCLDCTAIAASIREITNSLRGK